MAVFVIIEPDKDLAERLELFLFHDLLTGACREYLVGFHVLSNFRLLLFSHLLICLYLPCLVQVLASSLARSRPTLLWSSSDLRVEKLLACLRIIQIVC